jgi:hypothetical protein
MANQNEVNVIIKVIGAEKFKADVNNAMKSVDNSVSNSTKSLSKKVSSAMNISGATIRTGFNNIGMAISAATAIAGTALAGIGAIALKNASAYEQSQVAFGTMLKSADKAKKLMSDLQKFSLSTPFRFQELLPMTKQLLAYGVAQKKIIPTLTTLGNIGAGLGMDTLPRLIYAFGQIKARGMLVGTEMRQITETGLNLRGEFAKMRGVSEKVFNSQDITKWEITFAEFEKALKSVEKAQFNGMMIKQASTLEGLVSNIQDSLEFIGINVVMKSGIFDAIKNGALKLYTYLSDHQDDISKWAENIRITVTPKLKDIGSKVSGLIGNIQKLKGDDVERFARLFALLGATGVATSIIANLNPISLALGILAADLMGFVAAYNAFNEIQQIEIENKNIDAAIKRIKQKSTVRSSKILPAKGTVKQSIPLPVSPYKVPTSPLIGFKSMPKNQYQSHASGGIIGGSSPYGDKVLTRVNSGEMVLTKGQQGVLFSLLKRMASGNNVNINAPINFGNQQGAMQQQNTFTNMLRNLAI